MFRTKQQNSRLHALITQLNIDAETKEELVHKFTSGRTTSSSKMLVTECQSMINNLDAMTKGYTKNIANENTPENKMRRRILSICHEMGWKKEGVLDWEKINAFLLKSGYLHKSLNEYTAKELPKLVTQFEQLLKSFYAQR